MKRIIEKNKCVPDHGYIRRAILEVDLNLIRENNIYYVLQLFSKFMWFSPLVRHHCEKGGNSRCSYDEKVLRCTKKSYSPAVVPVPCAVMRRLRTEMHRLPPIQESFPTGPLDVAETKDSNIQKVAIDAIVN